MQFMLPMDEEPKCAECNRDIVKTDYGEVAPGVYLCKSCGDVKLCSHCQEILPNHLSGCYRWQYDKN